MIDGLGATGRAELPQKNARLWTAAQALEASFLAEMLKPIGLGEPSESFGGGPGEERFASYLRTAQAEAVVDAGGIGLAESIYVAILKRENAG
ncbi:MAG: chemotaxis protein chel [Pseudomonadota bacterium]